jgi:hypothetical protein
MKSAYINIAFIVLRFAYKHGGRDLFIRAINNPNSKIDELAVDAVDQLLGYQHK